MLIYDYTTSGGKNVILEHINGLAGKIWEIKISQERIMYVIQSADKEVITMAFTKADIEKERQDLNELIDSDEAARKAFEEFQAKMLLQKKLIETRKAENMTQTDLANAAGLSQQAVSRIEKGSGVTVSSLIKYLSGLGYCIELKKL